MAKSNICKKVKTIVFIPLAIILIVYLSSRQQIQIIDSRLPKIEDSNEEFQRVFEAIQSNFVHRYCAVVPRSTGNFAIKLNNDIVKLLAPFDQNALRYFSQANLKAKKHPDLDFTINLEHGGHWAPSNCQARHKVAVIVAYKNREPNLRVFLLNLHPFLQKQELNYTIFIVEQANDGLFNKGILMNAAFHEIALKRNTSFDCYVFHDVDLIPTNDLNFYTCPRERPRHMSIRIGETDYRTFYPILVGGVLIFKREHFLAVNGYSNKFWGWGAEDDDMFYRMQNTKLHVERPANNTIYIMLKHDRQWRNTQRMQLLLEGLGKYKNEGLSTVQYKLKKTC